jgi:hypothetical protein
MDENKVVTNPFKQKGKGVKVYSSKTKTEPSIDIDESIKHEGCNCALCKMARSITREVRGEFNKYGKV